MDWGLFFGRFHPSIVHLPIGLLLLAALMEWFSRRPKYKSLQSAIVFVLLCGAISAGAAVICGWLLASEGGYHDSTLFWHRWLGVAITILAIFSYLVKRQILKIQNGYLYALVSGMVVLIMVTGHLGGTLSRGDDYLFRYAPVFVQNILGQKGQKSDNKSLPNHPDSVVIFTHLIQPIFETKCVNCHNRELKKGGLIMTSPEALLEGGNNDEIWAPGDPFESELFKRVTLPQTHRKFMPFKGETLTFSEIKLIQWWIEEGASFEEKLTENEVPSDIKALLLRDYAFDTKPKSYYELTAVSPLSAEGMQKLVENGFKARPLAHENYYLDVTIDTEIDSLSMDQFKALLLASNQITWLDVSGFKIKDEMLSVIGKLLNLTRLRLEQNPITNQGVIQLEGLQHLESLNLYGTKVTAEAIASFKKLPALKQLYLWQTAITKEDIKELEKECPHLNVDLGFPNN